jgi:hypothetical protein
MKRRTLTRGIILFTCSILAAAGLLAAGAQAENPRTQIWAGCELYDSVVTPATFKPNGKFDELYTGGNGFQDGVGLISDAAPRDRDYDGGRWHLNVLKGGVDPNKYSGACSADDLDPNDFMSTDQYFECPLLPRRGRN